MKRWNRHIERWLLGSMLMLLLMVSMLMLVACSEETDEPQSSQLRLSSATREGEATGLTEGNIKVYVTSNDAVAFEGSFSKYNTDAIWNSSNLKIKEHTQYYIYGYMPYSMSGTIAKPEDGDFSDGATLTLSNLPVFSDEDVRLIVGVQRVTDAVTTTTATEGTFGYPSGASSQNYVNLLMGHLYSQLQLRFCVDKTYYALRRIHLKSVTLKSTYVAQGEKVTATVNLRAGKGLKGQVVFSDAAATTPTTPEVCSLLSGANLDLVVKPEDNAENPVYTVLPNTVNCPHSLFKADGSYLTIECSYDVYDTNNKIVRENCTATNKVKVSGMAPGVKKILTLTITPTYLYVLSDEDLNNPTIVIN